MDAGGGAVAIVLSVVYTYYVIEYTLERGRAYIEYIIIRSIIGTSPPAKSDDIDERNIL